MIKINLLNSVTERQGGAVVAVDRKISSPNSRLGLMTVVVFVLLTAVVGWEVISTQMAKTEADRLLNEQKTIAAELEIVLAEQKELEGKIASIDGRIEAIKTLRSSQAGPSAVLDSMRERIAMVPGIYLESVEQSGDTLVFKGNSPDELQVTQFGRSLEFSNGLFSNLNIETNRTEIQNQNVSENPSSKSDAPKVQIVNFTIRCAYTPTKAVGADNGIPTNAAAKAPGTQPVQVAKN